MLERIMQKRRGRLVCHHGTFRGATSFESPTKVGKRQGVQRTKLEVRRGLAASAWLHGRSVPWLEVALFLFC